MENRTVWKFPLRVSDVQPVTMPAGARILHVAEQFGDLCLWALVDPDAPKETRVIAICGTGHPAPDDGRHIGSVMLHGSALVFHVFEAPRPDGSADT